MSDVNQTSSLSKGAIDMIGSNHVLWRCFLGDMTERKVKLLNRMSDEAYSPGTAQAVARFPTQMQEVILRLIIEKGMKVSEIVKSIGVTKTLVTTTCAYARKLGYLPEAEGEWGHLAVARQKYQERMREARIARMKAKQDPQSIMPIERGERQKVGKDQVEAIMKAREILLGKPKTGEPAPQAPQAPQPNGVHVVDMPGVEKDPSKRVVEVSLRMTVEELDDFVKAVNAKKSAEA